MAEPANYPNRLMQDKPKPSPVAAFDMEERKESEFKNFGDGEVLMGTLINIERISIQDRTTGQQKLCTRYTVTEIETEQPVCFLGCYQIDSKVRRSDVGHIIELRNEGTDKNVASKGNAMKIFKVRVSKNPAPGWAMNGTRITDEDVPFF